MWGSPLSGKTTFVKNHAGRSDVILDWDIIKQAVSLSDSHQEFYVQEFGSYHFVGKYKIK